MTIHCPRCGEAVEVNPGINRVEIIDENHIVVSWPTTVAAHHCPDITTPKEIRVR